uniref:Trafficking protein particle complex subunit 2 n=1 Tax=Fusarium oxysporum (strain Fo5176) TaxID=660025 RepID=A0A0D2XZH4_FUSOF
MSYYFAIVGTQDNPLFEHEFGTSKQGGDGQSRFSDQVRHLNQFILHSSLDIAEEVQWSHGQMYLKCIDKFFNNYISCFRHRRQRQISPAPSTHHPDRNIITVINCHRG